MDYRTDNKALTLLIPIQANEKVRVVVYDKFKDNAIYSDRTQMIKGSDKFIVRLPQTPRVASIRIIANSNKMRVGTIQEVPLKRKISAFDYKNEMILSFIKFAQEFCENAGILDADNTVYLSDDGKLRIDYVENIINPKTKQEMNTPARISVQRGIIEISKNKFKDYTIQERMAILSHEFSHFYLNKNIRDETEADINALKILLGLGYSRTEVAKVFLVVFHQSSLNGNRKQSAANKKRYLIIENFIKNFEKQTFSDYYYNINEKN